MFKRINISRDQLTPAFLKVPPNGCMEEIGQRAAVKKAFALGPEPREDLALISADERARSRKVVTNQRARAVLEEWIAAEAG